MYCIEHCQLCLCTYIEVYPKCICFELLYDYSNVTCQTSLILISSRRPEKIISVTIRIKWSVQIVTSWFFYEVMMTRPLVSQILLAPMKHDNMDYNWPESDWVPRIQPNLRQYCMTKKMRNLPYKRSKAGRLLDPCPIS